MLKFVSRDGVELPPALKEMSKAFETLNADSTSSDSSVRTPTSVEIGDASARVGPDQNSGKKRLNKELHIPYEREEDEEEEEEEDNDAIALRSLRLIGLTFSSVFS